MNLAGRGSSKLIDDNRRRQDRTTTVCSLSNTYTHTPPELGYVNSIDARKKKERSLCMDGARLIGSDDDLFLFFPLLLCRMSKQEFLYVLMFFLFIDLSVYMLSSINNNYSNQYAR